MCNKKSPVLFNLLFQGILGCIYLSWTTPIIGQSYDLNLGQNLILHSDLMHEDRVLTIAVPVGYDSVADELPVVYVLDSEYRFLPTLGIYRYQTYWGGLPKAILVGISNPDRAARVRDYTPVAYGGHADQFIQFFEKELIPYIDQHYRTGGRRHIIGHSHGGVFVMYAFLTKPDLFHGYISCDPGIRPMLSYVDEKLLTAYTGQRLYLASSNVGPGVDESIILSHRSAVEEVQATLIDKSPKGLFLKTRHVSDDHANSYVQACSEGLRHIFNTHLK